METMCRKTTIYWL